MKKQQKNALIRDHIDPLVDITLAFRPPRRALEIAFKCLDDAHWVPARTATHMRDDDYALGLKVGDKQYCVPIHIIDYYHTINTEIAGHPSFFSS